MDNRAKPNYRRRIHHAIAILYDDKPFFLTKQKHHRNRCLQWYWPTGGVNCAGISTTLPFKLVISFASVTGCVGENAKSLYSLTKGALISGCCSLAIEYAPKKIRINVVSPRVVETAINRNQPYLADPERRKHIETLHPLGIGTTEDIPNASVYLLSDACRWLTQVRIWSLMGDTQ